MGGDEPVEALTEVSDRHRTGERRTADRQVKVDERMARVRGRQDELPSRAWTPLDRRVAVADGHLTKQRRAAFGGNGRRKRGDAVQLSRTFSLVGRSEHNRPRLVLNGRPHDFCLAV